MTIVKISSTEWKWAVRWAIIMVLLSAVPYVLAAWLAPTGWQFAGALANPVDTHAYLAKMKQGEQGYWLARLTHTPEAHNGVFIYLLYLSLGHTARLTGLSLVWMFHLARLLSGFLLLMTTFRFIAHISPKPTERRLAFILVISSGGLGWLGLAFGTFPIDLWVPEAFAPYTIYTSPHFSLAMALMLIIIQLVLWPPSKTAALLFAGFAGLALALILPFTLLTVWSILAIFLTWLSLIHRQLPWFSIWLTVITIIFAAPVLIYDYWVSTTHPVFAGWSAQNITLAPALLDVGLGYGLNGLLALFGLWQIGRKRPIQAKEWLLIIWVVTTLVLIYLPISLQRRLIMGLHIPICTLTAITLTRFVKEGGWRNRLTIIVVTLGIMGTALVWMLPIMGLLSPASQKNLQRKLYLRQDEITALNWLDKHSDSSDVILASPWLGMFVPEYTGAHAYFGHPFETINADEKTRLLKAFYRGEIDAVIPAADFVIYGPSERELGQLPGLADSVPVFSAGEVQIYQPSAFNN
jgi:hypothetical protein